MSRFVLLGFSGRSEDLTILSVTAGSAQEAVDRVVDYAPEFRIVAISSARPRYLPAATRSNPGQITEQSRFWEVSTGHPIATNRPWEGPK